MRNYNKGYLDKYNGIKPPQMVNGTHRCTSRLNNKTMLRPQLNRKFTPQFNIVRH